MAADGAAPTGAAGAMDVHHREFFSFDTSLFLTDLSNIGIDYAITAVHRLEQALHELPLFSGQDASMAALAPNCPAEQQFTREQAHAFKAAVSEALAEVQRRMERGLNQAADNFERLEVATNLHVPPELFMEQPMLARPEPVEAAEEAQLDAELEQLRQQAQQARSDVRQLKQQLRARDQDLSKAAARAAAFKPVAEALAGSSGPLLEEVTAIAQLAAKLHPMLVRAQQLQQEHGSGGGGSAASCGSDLAGLLAAPPAADTGGVADAERRVRLVMGETGASLQQLQAANAALTGGA